MFSSLKSLISSVTALIIAITAFYWGFSSLFPPVKKLTPERREALTLVVKPLLEHIPKSEDHIVRLMVTQMDGDFTGEVSEYFRTALEATGHFNVLPASTVERVRKEMHLEPLAVADVDTALKIARGAKCEQVLWGRVNRLAQQDSRVSAKMAVALFDTASGRQLWTEEKDLDTPNLFLTRARADQPFSWVGFLASIPGMMLSVLASVLFTMIFALLLTPAIRRVLERESNGLNFTLLLTLTLGDAAAGLLIMRSSFAGLAWVVLTLLIAVASLWYNYWYCEVINRKR